MKNILMASIAIILASVAWPMASGTINTIWAQTVVDPHAGHDDDKEKPTDEKDEHADEKDEHADEKDEHADEKDEHADEKDEHAGHGHEEGADEPGAVIPVTAAQIKKFGIVLSNAAGGKLAKEIRLPGEITLDADHSAHIVARAAGVVQKVLAKVGDRVKAGDTLAILDSAELGEAKILYLTKMNALKRCAMDLARAEAIDANTVKLLGMLDKSPDLDALMKIKFADMGSGHSTLISSYAELVFTQAEYEREKKLFEEKITSKADYQTAASAYKKAYAVYIAARSSIAYESRRGFLDAKQSLLNVELALKSEDRKLHLHGMTSQDIESLRAAAGTAPGKPAKDDHGHDILDETLGQYALRAPFDGVVIQKHLALGEKIADAEAFTIADMSKVWVDLSVYQKDLPFVKKGQKVYISLGHGIPSADGVISLVSSVVDETTRTCLARVVLDNEKGRYRPGLFVTAEVKVSSFDIPVLVPNKAVMQIEGKSCVFVADAKGLKQTFVKTGRSSRTHVEIVSGLEPGQRYVSTGAFQLKAKIITSGLDAHAGHGH